MAFPVRMSVGGSGLMANYDWICPCMTSQAFLLEVPKMCMLVVLSSEIWNLSQTGRSSMECSIQRTDHVTLKITSFLISLLTNTHTVWSFISLSLQVRVRRLSPSCPLS